MKKGQAKKLNDKLKSMPSGKMKGSIKKDIQQKQQKEVLK
jgi:hypothetical protein